MALDNYTGKYTGAGQTIVVIDTGISGYYTNNNVVYSYDFADNDSDAINEYFNHGGHVANVAQQVASDVQIIHLKVFSDGLPGAYNEHVEEALQWAVKNVDTYGITAVNMSLGSKNVQTPTTWLGSDEYQALDDKGVVITVASGNSRDRDHNSIKGRVVDGNFVGGHFVDGVNTLSSSENVFSVSAVNKSGNFTIFSQNHENLTDIAALGEDIRVIDDKGGSQLISGTSFSAPIIAAAAAIIQEAATVLLGHKITDEEFMDLIQKTGDKITGYALHSGKASSSAHSQSNKLGMSTFLELDVDDNTIATAQDIGVLAIDTKVLQDSVTRTTDDKDFYKFTLTADSQVDILLSKLSAPVGLSLYASDGKVFYQGFAVNYDHITYKNILTTGVYFVKVDYDDYSHGSTMTSYDLSLSATPTDNTIATAQDIGVLAIDTKVLQDSVTRTTDDKDFYKFTLTADSQVDILLSKLSASVGLSLYASDGKVFYQGFAVNDNHITYKKILTAGVYFVKVEYYVYSDGPTMTSYDLSLGATPTDNTIATAQDIGVLAIDTKVLQDSVTRTTDDKDFYKFTLTADSQVDILLSKLSASVGLSLYASDGKVFYQGFAVNDNHITYKNILTTGVYFVKVEYYVYSDGPTMTSYDLSLSATTDSTIVTAQDIGVLAIGSTKALQDSVTKTTDDKDSYKFELTTDSKVDFLLSNLSAYVGLNLYNEEGESIKYGQELSGKISYMQLLAAGTYYAAVEYYSAIEGKEASTTYDLKLKASKIEAPADATGYVQINLANAVTYLETHQSIYDDQIIL